MKYRPWHFCLILLTTPYFLLAQADEIAIASDTFTSPVAFTPFISFQTLIRDNKKIIIQWEVRLDSADYFTIERSVEGKTFEAIGVLKAIESLNKYEFSDEFPSRGQVYYRIRYRAKNGNEIYSQLSTVILHGVTFFRFYPNPADKLLILRAEFPLELLITDGYGKLRISKSLDVGPQVLDVSFLEKGTYILRITDKISGRQQFDKFLKN